MKTLSVKLPSALAAQLNALARRRKTSKSALMRQAVEKFLAAQGARRGSLLDRIRDLVGCVEGPGDLSVNKKYFRDFGK